jgi:signal transduction histidine kinase
LVGDVDLRRESGLIAQNERATQPFGQAAHNLLDNAAKYSPADAPIRLKTASEGSEARIAVEEAGPGIPEDEQKEIFEAFYRGAATKQSGVKGTGIGLSASRQIVDAHGGRITLASTPGAGSQFEIVLPLDRGGAGRRDDGEHPGS